MKTKGLDPHNHSLNNLCRSSNYCCLAVANQVRVSVRTLVSRRINFLQSTQSVPVAILLEADRRLENYVTLTMPKWCSGSGSLRRRDATWNTSVKSCQRSCEVAAPRARAQVSCKFRFPNRPHTHAMRPWTKSPKVDGSSLSESKQNDGMTKTKSMLHVRDIIYKRPQSIVHEFRHA